MSLTLSEVEHIANLARLDLSPDELARYREQLSAILDYAVRLQQLDTSAIAPSVSALDAGMPLREDLARTALDPEKVLRNAPQSKDNQFRVPPVLE